MLLTPRVSQSLLLELDEPDDELGDELDDELEDESDEELDELFESDELDDALEDESDFESPPELAPLSELPLLLPFDDLESPSPSVFFLSLKSVSYQPVPLSRKLGADNSFFSVLSLQFGQSRNGSSLSF